ncbi:MAG: hypothetical protein LBB84_12915 [Tannerellaceae bacterium]|jgi:hypothetical protein|nr:hypothetical protein [Tannerellaceae bacterium]
MRKSFCIVLFLLAFGFVMVINAQSSVRSGLLVGGGIGDISPDWRVLHETNPRYSSLTYQYNASIGYRFRYHPSLSSRLFFDLDANVGLKQWNVKDVQFSAPSENPYNYPIVQTPFRYLTISVGGTVNHPVAGGLSIGAGIEPTYYRRLEGEGDKNTFDLPLVGKIAYDFGPVELGLQYKYGFAPVARSHYINNSKVRDLQISVFVPF